MSSMRLTCRPGGPRSVNYDVIKWKHFQRYWPCVRGFPRSPVNSPHKGQRCGALMFSVIYTLNKRLSKQSWCWWFDMPSPSLWRHCNDIFRTLVIIGPNRDLPVAKLHLWYIRTLNITISCHLEIHVMMFTFTSIYIYIYIYIYNFFSFSVSPLNWTKLAQWAEIKYVHLYWGINYYFKITIISDWIAYFEKDDPVAFRRFIVHRISVIIPSIDDRCALLNTEYDMPKIVIFRNEQIPWINFVQPLYVPYIISYITIYPTV